MEGGSTDGDNPCPATAAALSVADAAPMAWVQARRETRLGTDIVDRVPGRADTRVVRA